MAGNNDSGQFNSSNIDLTQFENDFTQAEVQEHDFEPIPDGRYQVVIHDVELTRSQATQTPMLKWTLRILSSQFKGRLLWRNNIINTKENLKWLKTDLVTCGLELKKLSDLPENLPKLLNIALEVSKRTKGEWDNIYFNRRIDLNNVGNDLESTNHEALEPF